MYDAERIQHMKAGVGSMFSRSAGTYDQVGPRFFSSLGQRLVELANIQPGAAVLDVAAGRGAALFPAAERAGAQGQVIGIDLAEAMVSETEAEIQRRGLTNVEIYQMDAEDLSFPDAMFDVVLCGFGVSFFPQRAKACSELRRVLKAGGRLALSTWGRDDERWAWMREVQHKYRAPGEPLPAPAPNPFNNAKDLEAMMREAQFEQIRIISEDPNFVYPDEETWWAVQWSHIGRGLLETLSPEALDSYKAEAFKQMQVSKEADGFHHRLSTLFTLAVKPSSSP